MLSDFFTCQLFSKIIFSLKWTLLTVNHEEIIILVASIVTIIQVLNLQK